MKTIRKAKAINNLINMKDKSVLSALVPEFHKINNIEVNPI